ncbi:hypothetical protein SSTG_06194, partial [Streptomyces sp. e14]
MAEGPKSTYIADTSAGSCGALSPRTGVARACAAECSAEVVVSVTQRIQP